MRTFVLAEGGGRGRSEGKPRREGNKHSGPSLDLCRSLPCSPADCARYALTWKYVEEAGSVRVRVATLADIKNLTGCKIKARLATLFNVYDWSQVGRSKKRPRTSGGSPRSPNPAAAAAGGGARLSATSPAAAPDLLWHFGGPDPMSAVSSANGTDLLDFALPPTNGTAIGADATALWGHPAAGSGEHGAMPALAGAGHAKHAYSGAPLKGTSAPTTLDVLLCPVTPGLRPVKLVTVSVRCAYAHPPLLL